MGQPYVGLTDSEVLVAVDNERRCFVSIDQATPALVVLGSQLIFGAVGCCGVTGTAPFLPAREVTSEMSFTFPLALPIEIEPAP